MNKAFEKILGRLEEKLRKSEERYYRYLEDSNLPCIFDKSDIEETRVDTIKEMLEIVQEVAEEYNGGWIPCSERLQLVENEYNKALNDFVNACRSNILCQTFGLHINGIERITEQLKTGGNINE